MALTNFFCALCWTCEIGFVCKLVSCLLNHEVLSFENDEQTIFLRLEIITKLSEHEAWVPINFPNFNDLNMRALRLTRAFCERHYLVGELLRLVQFALTCQLPKAAQIRKKTLEAFIAILTKHNLDNRYNNQKDQSRIAQLFAPFIGFLTRHFYHLNIDMQDYKAFERNPSIRSAASSMVPFDIDVVKLMLKCYLHILNNLTEDLITDFWLQCSPKETETFFTILKMSINMFKHVEKKKLGMAQNLRETMNADANRRKSAVIATARTLAQFGISPTSSRASSRDPSPTRSHAPMRGNTLDNRLRVGPTITDRPKSEALSVPLFLSEAKPHPWVKGSRVPNNLAGRIVTRNVTPPPGSTNSKPPIFGDQNRSLAQRRQLEQREFDRQTLMPTDSDWGKHESAEVSLICLDLVHLFMVDHRFRAQMKAAEYENPLMKLIFEMELMFVDSSQPTLILHNGFSLLRIFIKEYRQALFRGRSELCKKIVYVLLRACNSKLSQIRQNAAATLYYLMHTENYEYSHKKGFGRSQLQIMGGIFRLISEKKVQQKLFQASLQGLKQLAGNEREAFGSSAFGFTRSTFSNDVKELIKRIRNVLVSTQQMKEHEDDPEKFVDLQHVMAQSYCDSPEHRKTWLEEMAKKHKEVENYVESAMCHAHIAGLLAELLHKKRLISYGCQHFLPISVNIPTDESKLKEDEELHYTACDLAKHLKIAADLADRSERPELIPRILNLAIPLYESQHDFEKLAEHYKEMQAAMMKALNYKTRKRFLGQFYRVALFGTHWEDDQNKIFIYKEPKITQLNEVRARLDDLYKKRFGDKFSIITDSKPVNVAELDVKIAYLQLTSVEPHFDEKELEYESCFTKAHNIRRFAFETPFTKEGKARTEDVTKQWMRKTIITTIHAFPYCTKRIESRAEEHAELSPPQIAIDSLRRKNKELAEVIVPPIDIKKLQLRLQGSVLVTVNAGSMAYAYAFLKTHDEALISTAQRTALMEQYARFVTLSTEALDINSAQLSGDGKNGADIMYHESLTNGLLQIKTELSEMGLNLDPVETV